jgi:hypothetical protein
VVELQAGGADELEVALVHDRGRRERRRRAGAPPHPAGDPVELGVQLGVEACFRVATLAGGTQELGDRGSFGHGTRADPTQAGPARNDKLAS